LPIGFQIALNAYTITLKAWNQLKPDQQAKLKAAFEADRGSVEVLGGALPDAVAATRADPCNTTRSSSWSTCAHRPTSTWCGAVSISLPAWAEVRPDQQGMLEVEGDRGAAIGSSSPRHEPETRVMQPVQRVLALGLRS
jgi:hypothetical protein